MNPQWVIIGGLILAAWGVLGIVVGQWLRTYPLWCPVVAVFGTAAIIVGGIALWLQDRTGWDPSTALAAVVLAWCVTTIGGVGLLLMVGALAHRLSERRRQARERAPW